jgi:hypothetical protein
MIELLFYSMYVMYICVKLGHFSRTKFNLVSLRTWLWRGYFDATCRAGDNTLVGIRVTFSDSRLILFPKYQHVDKIYVGKKVSTPIMRIFTLYCLSEGCVNEAYCRQPTVISLHADSADINLIHCNCNNY